jgi:hypothetical protein
MTGTCLAPAPDRSPIELPAVTLHIQKCLTAPPAAQARASSTLGIISTPMTSSPLRCIQVRDIVLAIPNWYIDVAGEL